MEFGDEDITTSDTTTPIEVQRPITRSRAQQLHHRVNSFLYSSINDLENRFLPNDLIVIRNQGVDHVRHVRYQEGAGEPSQENKHNKVEVQANSKSRSLTLSPTQSLGSPCLQINVHDASDL
jgi:hypothetical protein